MPFIKRLAALLLIGSLLTGSLLSPGAWAEEAGEEALISQVVDDGDGEEDAEEDLSLVSAVPTPPPVSIAAGDGRALYLATVVIDCSVRKDQSKEEDAVRLCNVKEGAEIEILDVDVDWVYARYNGVEGWMKRLWIAGRPKAIEPTTTPPYGVYPYRYTAVVARETHVQLAPGDGIKHQVTLGPGTKLALMDIYEGWARFFYKHTYGYVNAADLRDLTPVSPTETPISPETPIAAYTTYYSVADTESNRGRMKNIAVACERLSRVYEPGEELNFNADIGPYNRANGYFPAPVLVNGGSKLGYGGGTCQVSSTLFNVLLQLPGITVLQRRPHGQSGAKYLPIGMDAAVGSENLNLRFRNDYDFPVRLEAGCQDGALTMVMWKADS